MQPVLGEVRVVKSAAEQEARRLAELANRDLAAARTHLLQIQERQLWKHLGTPPYKSWGECLSRHFKLTPLFYEQELADLDPEDVLAAFAGDSMAEDDEDAMEGDEDAPEPRGSDLAGLSAEEKVEAINAAEASVTAQAAQADVEEAVHTVELCAKRMRRQFHGPLDSVREEGDRVVEEAVRVARLALGEPAKELPLEGGSDGG